MKRFPKILRVLLPLLLVLGVGFALINTFLVDFIVEALWYDSLGYLQFMLLKLGYKYIVLFGVTLVFFLMLFLNFWIASRYLGVTKFHKETKIKKIIQGFRSGSMKVYTPQALILAIPLALPIFREWESFLLLFRAPMVEHSDALFRLNVSFYLFYLPILKLLYGRILLTMILLLISLVVLYAAELKVLSKEGQTLYRGAKFHLSIVVFSIFLVLACGYGIQALMLQYSERNIDKFYGPGFTEFYVILPMLGLAAFMLLPLAFSVICLIYRGKEIKTTVLFLILALAAGFMCKLEFIPNSVKVWMEGSRLAKQGPFIQQSIDATLEAYNLQNVEKRVFVQAAEDAPLNEVYESSELENIPLWDNELLESVFQELQGLRTYYEFTGVDAARYMINGELHQVYLAAREINTDRLTADAKDWVNTRLKYTHGYGLVMTPAAQSGEQQMSWYIKNIPPESKVGFDIREASIYYGLADLDYIIAPNKSGEFHYSGTEEEGLVNIDYKGTGGVSVGNFWKRSFFAYVFKDRNLLFTTETLPESRIHFRRNIMERVKILTPFIEFDHNPYLVVTEDRLYWMIDAYTRSKWYPNAQTYMDDYNYIRNSIKVVVDAYDGSVSYYLADATDPIARAYQRMYPGLIKNLDEMPEDLRSQIRYPKDLFDFQMRVYARYHQENPETFYQSEDLLELAKFTHQDSLIEMKPYYLTLDMVEPGRREFLLLTPLLPYEKPNLRALAVVRSDGDAYGKMVFYTFPKGEQIFGPPLINAYIDQDSVIAQSMTLWNQQGSEVKRGKMIILPLKGQIIYIQPLYMEATGATSIPQLKRIIVSTGEKVAMDVSVEKAMRKLQKEMGEEQVVKDADSSELPADQVVDPIE